MYVTPSSSAHLSNSHPHPSPSTRSTSPIIPQVLQSCQGVEFLVWQNLRTLLGFGHFGRAGDVTDEDFYSVTLTQRGPNLI